MKTLDKETVINWIKQDISWRISKYQYPLACYYSYLKQKCTIQGYYVTDLDDILYELHQDDKIQKYVHEKDYCYTLI